MDEPDATEIDDVSMGGEYPVMIGSPPVWVDGIESILSTPEEEGSLSNVISSVSVNQPYQAQVMHSLGQETYKTEYHYHRDDYH